ncbi:MAG: DUF1292 domain-containing protein [Clostridia bacterium]|nr:DUF1292 domain-containing protein [Clostridia bacterium]
MATKEVMTEIDKILDEECTDNIVLYDENNKETEFEQVALIPKDEKIYVILKPVTKIEGVADDEALVFVIDEIEDQDCLIIVDDEQIITEVFNDYYKLLEEYNED